MGRGVIELVDCERITPPMKKWGAALGFPLRHSVSVPLSHCATCVATHPWCTAGRRYGPAQVTHQRLRRAITIPDSPAIVSMAGAGTRVMLSNCVAG